MLGLTINPQHYLVAIMVGYARVDSVLLVELKDPYTALSDRELVLDDISIHNG